MTAPHRVLLPVYFLAGCVYVFHASIVVDGERYFTLWDDAMISMRYAANLEAAGELAWNLGEPPVQGFSNPGVVAVMAALHALPLAPAHVALGFQLLSLLVLLAIAVLVYRLTPLLFDCGPGFAAAAMIAVALHGGFNLWTLQGADFGVLALLLLLALERLLSGLRTRDAWPRSVFALLALGVVVRLDFVLVYVAFLVAALLLDKPRWRVFLGGAALLAAVVAALTIWSQLVFGDPLPNTFYLKTTGLPRGLMLRAGLRDLVARGGLLTLPWLLLVAGTLYAGHRRDRRVLFVAGLAALPILYNVWIGGDWYPRHPSRFLVPAMPLVVILGVGSCVTLVRLLRRRGIPLADRPLAGWRPLALGVLASLALNTPASVIEWWTLGARGTMLRSLNAYALEIGIYLREQTAPETRVAFQLGGIPAYFSGRPGIDVWGRSDRHIARLEASKFFPGHSKFDWTYVLRDRRPDVILAIPNVLTPAQTERLLADYVKAESPGGSSFYLRKASRHLLLDPAVTLSSIDPAELPAHRVGPKPRFQDPRAIQRLLHHRRSPRPSRRRRLAGQDPQPRQVDLRLPPDRVPVDRRPVHGDPHPGLSRSPLPGPDPHARAPARRSAAHGAPLGRL